ETTTTNLSLNYTTSGYVNSWEDHEYNCFGTHLKLIIYFGFSMGICVCGLVGNGTVMWFLIFHMKQNPFTVYVLNLAIADFSLLLHLLVYLTVYIISGGYCFISYDTDFFVNYILLVPFVFCYYSSMYLLTAMSVERCLAVL
ncbi:MRGRH protein, partial [Bucco capensis]|nr:MRGRH protein [Bucco capensis]